MNVFQVFSVMLHAVAAFKRIPIPTDKEGNKMKVDGATLVIHTLSLLSIEPILILFECHSLHFL